MTRTPGGGWDETLDVIAAPCLILDASDRIARLNRAAARALGQTLDSCAGEPLARFGGDERFAAALDLTNESRRTGQAAECVIERKVDETCWLLEATPLLQSARGESVFLFLRDISLVIRAERKVNHDEGFKRLNAIAEAVAHDVRGPLASLSVYLDLYALENGGGPEIEDAFAPMHRGIRKINDLMQALLDYGRAYPQGDQRSDLYAVAQEAAAAKRGEALAASVSIENRGEPGVVVAMDRPRVRQAIEHLIENAIQQAPKDSSVLVHVSALAGRARCRVLDRGAGIGGEALLRAFEPFQSRRKGGTGLGLAIVKRIAEQHGGRVQAANGEAGGCEMTLELPI